MFDGRCGTLKTNAWKRAVDPGELPCLDLPPEWPKDNTYICNGGLFGEDSGDDDPDYVDIMNLAIVHSNPDLLSLSHATKEYTHFWQANNYVCHWVKTHRISALLVTEDLCTKCFDITATLAQVTHPIFNIDQGSLGSRVFNMKM
ncbi:uncharacterized protein LOC117111484 [Anneissia japonica]|uniref:uncharacterized protein LOC117111484 n=1 Tax=Anneissia japonica TaxID=1529436 RepID=UPI0014258953|nr:uncharacterized protein LOC117111484 [Anneissia japonica]